MRITIAITLLFSGLLFVGGALGAVAAMRRGGGPRAYPALVGYLSIAIACVGEAGWLLAGNPLP